MEMKFADRLRQIDAGIFSELNDRKNELIAQGRKVYNMSIGTPDFQPAPHIVKAVSDAAMKPENYKYSIADLPELLDAVSAHYERRFGVKGIRHSEIMSLYGSQEGMAHVALALCNPGDIVLVPNPGYPVFSAGPLFCGADVRTYDLHEENGFLIEFDKIPEDLAQQAKCMIVSYPLNPVCAAAPDSFYPELIAFARKYNIIVLHDNAYSDIIYGGRTGRSFLSFEGAKDVGAEFYSLSKSYNYTGARMSFLVGNEEIIKSFKQIRSQIDYGIFYPVQYGAIAALTGPQDQVKAQCAEYDRRNHALSESMTEIGWKIPLSQGTMFSWAPIPEGFENSVAFVRELMDRSGLIVTPGSSFGSLGEGYVRLALVLPPEKIREAAQAVKESGVLNR